MATRNLTSALRSMAPFKSRAAVSTRGRLFNSSAIRLEAASAPVPAPKKPVGAFRGGAFGFLLGSSMTGAAMYAYILDNYQLANEMVNEEISNLTRTVHRLETHVSDVEARLAEKGKSGK